MPKSPRILRIVSAAILAFGLTASATAQHIAVQDINYGNGAVVAEGSGTGVPTASCHALTRYVQTDAPAGQNIWQCVNGTMVRQGGAAASSVAHASTADYATNAGHANTADYATTAGSAASATTASTANALAATPSACLNGTASTGIKADGSPAGCISVTGSTGGSNGTFTGTAGTLPIFVASGSAVTLANSPFSYSISTGITSTVPLLAPTIGGSIFSQQSSLTLQNLVASLSPNGGHVVTDFTDSTLKTIGYYPASTVINSYSGMPNQFAWEDQRGGRDFVTIHNYTAGGFNPMGSAYGVNGIFDNDFFAGGKANITLIGNSLTSMSSGWAFGQNVNYSIEQFYSYSTGLMNMHTDRFGCFNSGDCNVYYGYGEVKLAAIHGSDEGIRTHAMEVSDAQDTTGKVQTRTNDGAGNTALVLTSVQYGTESAVNQPLLDLTLMTAANATSMTYDTADGWEVLGLDTTVAASLPATTVSAITIAGNSDPYQEQYSMTQKTWELHNVVVNTANDLSSLVGQKCSIISGIYSEYPVIQSVGTLSGGQQTLSLYLQYPHSAGVAMNCGGLAGHFLTLNSATHTITYNSDTTAVAYYPYTILSSTTSSVSVAYRVAPNSGNGFLANGLALGGVQIYPGAYTTSVEGVNTYGGTVVDGTHISTAQVETATFAAGDTVVLGGDLGQSWDPIKNDLRIWDPMATLTGYTESYSGYFQAGRSHFEVADEHSGGVTFAELQGKWNNGIIMDTSPNGDAGALLHVASHRAGSAGYYVWVDTDGGSGSSIYYNIATGNLAFNVQSVTLGSVGSNYPSEIAATGTSGGVSQHGCTSKLNMGPLFNLDPTTFVTTGYVPVGNYYCNSVSGGTLGGTVSPTMLASEPDILIKQDNAAHYIIEDGNQFGAAGIWSGSHYIGNGNATTASTLGKDDLITALDDWGEYDSGVLGRVGLRLSNGHNQDYYPLLCGDAMEIQDGGNDGGFPYSGNLPCRFPTGFLQFGDMSINPLSDSSAYTYNASITNVGGVFYMGNGTKSDASATLKVGALYVNGVAITSSGSGSSGTGSGTVNSGTAFGAAYYATASTAVSAAPAFNGPQCDSTTAAPTACSPAQMAAASRDTTQNTSIGFAQAASGSDVMPTYVSGVNYLVQYGGRLAYVNSGSTTPVTLPETLADHTAIGLAPLASPALTGTPTAPTQAAGDNSTDLATDAFVSAALAAPRLINYTSVTAAATIAPTTAMFRITGTATSIATITPFAGSSSTVATCVDFLTDAAQSFTTAGNIGSAAFTSSASHLYHACYLGGTWYINQ